MHMYILYITLDDCVKETKKKKKRWWTPASSNRETEFYCSAVCLSWHSAFVCRHVSHNEWSKQKKRLKKENLLKNLFSVWLHSFISFRSLFSLCCIPMQRWFRNRETKFKKVTFLFSCYQFVWLYLEEYRAIDRVTRSMLSIFWHYRLYSDHANVAARLCCFQQNKISSWLWKPTEKVSKKI